MLIFIWLIAVSTLSTAASPDTLAGKPAHGKDNPVQSGNARLCIIIDDIGYSMERGRRAIELPGPITLAVIPFTPNAYPLAELASRSGKDVILHQPMQAVEQHRRFHTSHTLTLDMSPEDFRHTLNSALDSLPNVVGVNNHTGSLLTQRQAPMAMLMQQIHRRHLFFLDSRTTPASIAARVARETGVPTLQRDLFLDHVPEPSAIAAAFQTALDLAARKGTAVIIAHPHATTLDFLERAIPRLAGRGYTLIAAKELVLPVYPAGSLATGTADAVLPGAKAKPTVTHAPTFRSATPSPAKAGPEAPARLAIEGSPHTTPAL